MKNRVGFFIGFLIILGVLAYLFFNTFQSSLQYYVTVSELSNQESKYFGKTLKVAGTVKDIKNVGNDQTFVFTVFEGGQSRQVSYAGFTPDTFRDGADIVVTGHLTENGNFEASEVLAKCASKYEVQLQ